MDTRKILFVGGIPVTMTEETLQAHFEQFCRVNRVRVMREKKTLESKGYAFVTVFTSADAATVASRTHIIGDRKVDVQIASRKNEKKDWKADQKKRKVFVINLPENLDGESLALRFSQFGEVRNAYIIFDYETKKSKSYGYVEFMSQTVASRLVNTTVTINDKDVSVLPYIGRHEQKTQPDQYDDEDEFSSSVKMSDALLTEATSKRNSLNVPTGTNFTFKSNLPNADNRPPQAMSVAVAKKGHWHLLEGTVALLNTQESNYRYNIGPRDSVTNRIQVIPSTSTIRKEYQQWDIFGRSLTPVTGQESPDIASASYTAHGSRQQIATPAVTGFKSKVRLHHKRP